jgi:hypothetical protein
MFNLDVLFQRPTPKFLELMEVEELVSDYISEESWADSVLSGNTTSEPNHGRKKKWTRGEEEILARFVSSFGTQKIPTQAWNEIAVRLGRTVCSVHTKAAKLRKNETTHSRAQTSCKGTKAKLFKRKNLDTLITSALQNLSGERGTKTEICDKI